jgi:catechol 2,3-dioxygenase-like lactoylglutathione lyase family enzyme
MTVRVSGVHHVGVPVRNLDASLRWYEQVLGATPTAQGRTEGQEFAQMVAVPDAVCAWALLDLGSTKLELLEYEHPRGEEFALRNCDVGALHVAFAVDDVEQAFAELQTLNVEYAAPPVLDPDEHYLYFRDPNGVQLELYATPPSSDG